MLLLVYNNTAAMTAFLIIVAAGGLTDFFCHRVRLFADFCTVRSWVCLGFVFKQEPHHSLKEDWGSDLECFHCCLPSAAAWGSRPHAQKRVTHTNLPLTPFPEKLQRLLHMYTWQSEISNHQQRKSNCYFN